MSKKYIFLFLIIATISGIVAYRVLHGASQEDGFIGFSFNTNQEIDFNTQIQPILNKNCITCHGGVKRSGDFSLLFPADALEANESGKPAIVPGSPRESEMIRRIRHHDPEVRMPPEREPLPAEEIELHFICHLM